MLMLWTFLWSASITVKTVLGHGQMVMPRIWWDKDDIGMLEGYQCAPGFWIDDLPAGPGTGASCLWFTNDTFLPHSPSLDNSFRTYKDIKISDVDIDWTKHNPWRSPGSAQVYSPCGNAGGNPLGCPVGTPRGEGMDCPGGGYSHGPNAENYVERLEDVYVTEWQVGSVAEVAWGIIANHGGGYSYRLCKIPEAGMSALTEECFQQTPLDFVGELQWVQYGRNTSSRVGFVANRTREGTYPSGSQWTKNPIPACSTPDGGFISKCKGTQFPEPAPGLYGFGVKIDAPGIARFKFNIVDKVQIPTELEPGNYVLSFRWDCEQSPQIWSGCSSIRLLGSDSTANLHHPIIQVIP